MNASLTATAEHDVSRLTNKVSDLIALCQRLRQENASLHEQRSALTEERALLLEKNELARSRVEAIINRLKSMESTG